jgi:hypothetical protein
MSPAGSNVPSGRPVEPASETEEPRGLQGSRGYGPAWIRTRDPRIMRRGTDSDGPSYSEILCGFGLLVDLAV